MRRPQILAFGLAGIVVVAATAAWWVHRTHPSSESPAGQAVETPGTRKILYWHDPMVPTQRFDKPGKSPFMDMQLVPVYADDVSGSGGVRVSSSVAQNLGIRIGKVERERVRPRLAAVGSVAFDEHRVEVVQARVTGYVTKLYVKAPLDHVRRGQPLADITSPEWLQALGEYAALLADHSASTATLRDAARRRLVVLDVPETAIASLERTGALPAVLTIVAPINGVISDLGVRDGATFMTGASLFRINGLQTVWVNAQIPEAQRYLIPMGSAVTARATGWPGVTFRGRVEAILPEVEPTTRTLIVRAVLDNSGGKLTPGMFASLDLEAPPTAPQLVVPSEAVIATGQRVVVITAGENGSFAVAPVVVGPDAGAKTVILSGLTEGQSIVLSGQFLIDSEASLTSTVARLATAAATTPGGESVPAVMHLGQGTVQAIGKDDITIAHIGVPSLNWAAMTKAFKRPLRGLPMQLKVGDTVTFIFSGSEEDGFTIDSIATIDPGPSAPAAEPPR